MVAIILDEENYIKSYSDKFRTPDHILVDSLPDESDPEKLKCYQFIDGEFVFNNEKWAELVVAETKAETERAAMAEIKAKRAQISELKATLEQSDYKILKCYEYALNDLKMPYDAEKLHAERQALRDKINELETNLQ